MTWCKINKGLDIDGLMADLQSEYPYTVNFGYDDCGDPETVFTSEEIATKYGLEEAN